MTDPTGMYSWREFGSDAWGVAKGIGTAVAKVGAGIGVAAYQGARSTVDPVYAVKRAVGAAQGAVSGTKELVSNVKAEGGVGGALSAAYNQALDNYQGADAAGKAEMIATPLVETFAALAPFAKTGGATAPGEIQGPSPLINEGAQGKHVPGHNNFQPGKSELTANPAELGRQAGTGSSANGVPAGTPGARERVNFGTNIGNHVDPSTGAKNATTNGIIHYSKRGIHIVPSRP